MGQSNTLVSYHKALMELSHQPGFTTLPRPDKLAALTALVARLLDVKRVGVWLYSAGRDRIRCEWLHHSERQDQSPPPFTLELTKENHPDYFSAIGSERVVTVADAARDPRTRSFLEGYLKPEGIAAMLDSPIFDGERLSGVLCIEDGAPRDWTVPEISLAVAVADTISLINTHEAWLHSKRTIEYMNRYDAMTGLANIRSLKERIEQLMDGLHGNGCDPMALIWVDLDRLKSINDGLGPQAGDQVIAGLGRRLADVEARGRDMLARIAGDEFALLIRRHTDADNLECIARAIHAAMAEPIVLNEQALTVSVSLGICLFPSDCQDAEDLLRGAEAAMYHAKREGRSRSIQFDSAIQMTARSRFALERDLRSAIERAELDVFYQPIMDPSGQRLESLEALVRWNHPERGWLAPIEFLDVARSAGLMVALGNRVLQAVCGYWRLCTDAGLSIPTISVNLSAEQVQVSSLPDQLRRLCDAYDMPVSALHFEVTEDAIQGDLHIIRSVLEGLVNAGAELAIDDFGTGYSSLSRLKSLPFSRIKIDRSFISDLPFDEDDCAITLSILGLARGLGLSVVAEGVETEDHERWLCQQNCDFLQGYRYSRPLPADEFTARFLQPAHKNAD